MKVLEIIKNAQLEFQNRMQWLEANGGLTEDVYLRYLSMEYHLTKGVQRPFMIAASHPDMTNRRSLRKFLFDFACEEELHYSIALNDIENMNQELLPCTTDVKLWWAYFDSIIYDRPFVRLGATCILENISGTSNELLRTMMKAANYLNPKNTCFFVIHQHEEIPHGAQIIAALQAARLEQRHLEDLVEGAKLATVMYLRMVDECIHGRDIF